MPAAPCQKSCKRFTAGNPAVCTCQTRTVAAKPLPQSKPAVAASHRESSRQMALLRRGPPVSMRTELPCCAALGGGPHGGCTGIRLKVSRGSPVSGVITRHTASSQAAGKRVAAMYPAGAGDQACAATR